MGFDMSSLQSRVLLDPPSRLRSGGQYSVKVRSAHVKVRPRRLSLKKDTDDPILEGRGIIEIFTAL